MQAPEHEGPQGVTWYLSHRPVLNPNKPNKMRVVFDCSKKYDNASLNDKVLQGPDLNNKLVGVLLCFRSERIAVMADVESLLCCLRIAKICNM